MAAAAAAVTTVAAAELVERPLFDAGEGATAGGSGAAAADDARAISFICSAASEVLATAIGATAAFERPRLAAVAGAIVVAGGEGAAKAAATAGATAEASTDSTDTSVATVRLVAPAELPRALAGGIAPLGRALARVLSARADQASNFVMLLFGCFCRHFTCILATFTKSTR